jgi:hypothetical protein
VGDGRVKAEEEENYRESQMTEPNRLGFTGGKGDTATVTITDNGYGVCFRVDLPHKPNPEELETAVEAALDLMFEGVDIDWRSKMGPRVE